VTTRRALLIGTENYRDDQFTRLPSTRADLLRLREVLADRAVGGFDVDVRENLTADEMRRAIDDFCREADSHQLTLIYITGHGARGDDGEFVFVAADTHADRLGETGVRAGFVNDRLEDCYADQKVAVFDTCESGAFVLGLRSAPAKGAAVPTASRPPLTPRGVYVLASSDVSEASYSGRGTVAEPEPSVFTAAVVDVLRTGAAGTSASGMVSVDDLFKAVAERLRIVDPPQTPVKSAYRVSADIPIAARPLGSAPRLIDQPPVTTTEVVEFDGEDPDWPRLLAYYTDVVRAEIQDLPLLPVRGSSHVMLSGSERALLGDVDADGCLPVPPGAEELVKQASARNGPELWTGWPAVLLYRNSTDRRRWRGPQFAPLLIRQLEVVITGGVPRLRPDGPVVPHPGLMKLLLDDESASQLAISYRPAWHQRESGRLAQEAGLLLRDEFALPCVEELRPEQLSGQVNTATAGEGARNAAVMFSITPDNKTRNLLRDLEWILGRPTAINRTALAALYPGSGDGPVDKMPRQVLPLPANPAQRAVLESAMTRRLTVATGPPGTGKSQLVVNAAATAVAAGQTVLVASTNNTAVDEVHRRCETLVPGLVLRTGNANAQIVESDGLQAMLARSGSTRTPESREQALRLAARRLEQCERRLTEVAQLESELLALGRDRRAAEQALGRTVEQMTADLGEGWGARAAALRHAFWFGAWRRRRFLQPAGLDTGDMTETCESLTSLSQLDDGWRSRRAAATETPDDDDLDRNLLTAQVALAQASTSLLDGLIADRAAAGQRELRELWQVKENGGKPWDERRAAMAYVKGWAVTSYSARQFKTEPAMFDLVIIDEASQCTIPAIVPLLYRARRALVIGDMMQLPHISTVDPRTDATLRAIGKIPRQWLTDHRLSPVKHSAFAAAEHVVGEPMLLDEHYRCHPDIIGVSNRLFYGSRLTVLTDTTAPGRVRVAGPPVIWRNVAGHAERGPSGTSWRNLDEVDEVERCVKELLATLPSEATIGVVTPYAPQSAELRRRLSDRGKRVQVGTAHAFQGGERDVMVLSLVAARNQPPRSFDWADHQPELWNVAITRAREQLIVVGDRSVWEERGRVGGELILASGTSRSVPGRLDEELVDRLHDALCNSPGAELELSVAVNGHWADAVFHDGGRERAIAIDPGSSNGEPAAHLRLMLRRRTLLGDDAARVPAWLLFDGDSSLRQRLDG
jgi:hypothetical protein